MKALRHLRWALPLLLLWAAIAVVAHDHRHNAPPAEAQDQPKPEELDQTTHAMGHHHLDMGPHMHMTTLRHAAPGDGQRAQLVVEAARKTMEKYRDYRAAEADGYKIFLPQVPQKMYHFTDWAYGLESAFRFNPEHPTSLLYEKQPGGYKLMGAMYTAPARFSEDDLDQRIPLSVARWHLHVNMCAPPKDRPREVFGPKPRFGLAGSITTEAQCAAAGGKFHPHVFGWMVHVYPDENTPEAIWSVERQHRMHQPSVQ